MKRVIKQHIHPIALWKECDGYYECPEKDGVYLGPLVGYAGTYTGACGTTKHYVGKVYFNFAAVEQYPEALNRFAQLLMLQLERDHPTVALGAPMGGIGLAFDISSFLGTRTIFAEKKFVADGPERETTKLVITRHELHPDDRVAIIEDVCNNFSTTQQLIDLVEASGATVCSIGCALNRSPMECYHPRQGGQIAVRSVLHKPSPQYRQDDLEVAQDVQAGNIVWKPKVEWERLMQAMQQ